MLDRDGETFKRLMAYYECAIMEVETKLRVFDAEFGLRNDRNPIEFVRTRLKSAESLRDKMERKGIPISVESIEQNVFDVAGVRVVCSLPEDAYSLADALAAQDDVEVLDRRDYMASPKESGYRSLHLIISIPIFLEHEKRLVKAEVQLRSIAQNFWASLNHQLKYKKGIDPAEEEAIAGELKQLSDDAAELDMRMQALRQRIFA